MASNPDLSMLAEIRAAVDDEGLSPAQALHAGTVAGARALGQLDRGRLEPGGGADLVFLEPATPLANRMVLEGVLLGETRVVATMTAGACRFRRT